MALNIWNFSSNLFLYVEKAGSENYIIYIVITTGKEKYKEISIPLPMGIR